MEYHFSNRLRTLYEGYRSKNTTAPETLDSDEPVAVKSNPAEVERMRAAGAKTEKGRTGRFNQYTKKSTQASLQVAHNWLNANDLHPNRSEQSRRKAVAEIAGVVRGLVYRKEVHPSALLRPDSKVWGVHLSKLGGLKRITDPNYTPPPASQQYMRDFWASHQRAEAERVASVQPKTYTPTKKLEPLTGASRVKMTGGVVLGKGTVQRVKPYRPVSGEEMHKRLRDLLTQATNASVD